MAKAGGADSGITSTPAGQQIERQQPSLAREIPGRLAHPKGGEDLAVVTHGPPRTGHAEPAKQQLRAFPGPAPSRAESWPRLWPHTLRSARSRRSGRTLSATAPIRGLRNSNAGSKAGFRAEPQPDKSANQRSRSAWHSTHSGQSSIGSLAIPRARKKVNRRWHQLGEKAMPERTGKLPGFLPPGIGHVIEE